MEYQIKKIKNNIKNVIFTLLTLSVFFACTSKSSFVPKSDIIRVGTFNMEWLGDGINDRIARTEEDYKRIAEVIESLQFDILGIQEIENSTAVQKVLKYLPGYQFILCEDANNKQNVGFIYHKGIEINNSMIYRNTVIEKDRTRPAMILSAKKGNFDFIIMVVHLKSTSRYDDTKEKREESYNIRTEQSRVISLWADSVLRFSKEQDIIIVGDFNDTPVRKKNNTLYWLSENPNLVFLTDSLKSCKYRTWYVIDHIVVSKSALNRYQKNSLFIFNLYDSYGSQIAETISDHCPITADFEVISPDND